MTFHKRYLDGEKLFKQYWIEMGSSRSILKLLGWCKTVGMVNPSLGHATRMGVWKSMWRWALKNPNEAYDIVNNAMKDTGDFLTKERWLAELQEKVKSSWQDKNYEEKWNKANS